MQISGESTSRGCLFGLIEGLKVYALRFFFSIIASLVRHLGFRIKALNLWFLFCISFFFTLYRSFSLLLFPFVFFLHSMFLPLFPTLLLYWFFSPLIFLLLCLPSSH